MDTKLYHINSFNEFWRGKFNPDAEEKLDTTPQSLIFEKYISTLKLSYLPTTVFLNDNAKYKNKGVWVPGPLFFNHTCYLYFT